MAFLKKLHKWVGLLIGIQVLIWALSGFIVSVLDPEKVSGNQWKHETEYGQAVFEHGKLLEPEELPVELLDNALSINLDLESGTPVYRIRRVDGTSLVNAYDGTVTSTTRKDAEFLARADFTGDGDIISASRGTAPDLETRDSIGEYWRVNFSDRANTSIYISVSSGDILERRNSYWRVFDFFWALHIMDYSGHEDINNALVISVALIAIWLGLSGFVLLFSSFNRHDFHFLNVFGKHEFVTVTLIDTQTDASRQFKLRKYSNLFNSLASHGVNLPSICGGGGECGKCRVKIEASDLPAANAVELGLIPKRLREQGYRLACQHELRNTLTLYLSGDALVSENGTPKSLA